MARWHSKAWRLGPQTVGWATIAVWLGLAGWSTVVNAPCWHEPVYLMSGVSIWKFGRFDAYCVNPPLVKVVAALPVLLMHPRLDPAWLDQPHPLDRGEFAATCRYVQANGPQIHRQILLARWVCLGFTLLGAIVCWRWADALFGPSSGIVALLLWCSCPYVLGHGSSIVNDVPAAAVGVAALWQFWRWLKRPRLWGLVPAGVVLGLAGLCKFTLLVLYPLLPLLWLVYRSAQRPRPSWSDWLQQSAMLVTLLLIACYVVNCGYLFEGTFAPLKRLQFQSRMFTGCGPNDTPVEANRLGGTWLEAAPVPLPANLLKGIDQQRCDFERGLPSYLRGQWSGQGCWYYYLYALAIKLPLGTWCLIALAVAATIFRWGCSAAWYDEMFVLGPFLAILLLVSSQTGFSVHSRYVIPVLPFLFIWASKAACIFQTTLGTRKRIAIAVLVVMALTWSVGSSLAVYPHSLSYFNELVGGPRYGAQHLLDSNIDWGQDLFYLKRWLDERPEVRLDGLAYHGSCPFTLAGIPETPLPPNGPKRECRGSNLPDDQIGPRPGWYALSVNYLYDTSRQYRYFLRCEPVAMTGYSIYIYHLTPNEANRLRRELGLQECSECPGANHAACLHKAIVK